jgi:hypothetical protein
MEDTSKGVPQFATAEFAPNSPTMTCAACRRPMTGPYFQINGAKVCAECTSKIQKQTPKDSHAVFVRALVFGIAGAVVGFALYVIFALVTGLVIGWISVAVGFIVGAQYTAHHVGYSFPKYFGADSGGSVQRDLIQHAPACRIKSYSLGANREFHELRASSYAIQGLG